MLFINDPIFSEALSNKIRGVDINEIRRLYNLSNPVSIIVDNMTSNVSANYPFNILHTMIKMKTTLKEQSRSEQIIDPPLKNLIAIFVNGGASIN